MLQPHQISTLRLPQSTLDIQLPSPLTSLRVTSNLLHIRLGQIPVHNTELYTHTGQLSYPQHPRPPSPIISFQTGQQRNRNAKLTLWHALPSRTRTPSHTNRTPPPSRFRARNNAIIFPSGVLRFSRNSSSEPSGARTMTAMDAFGEARGLPAWAGPGNPVGRS